MFDFPPEWDDELINRVKKAYSSGYLADVRSALVNIKEKRSYYSENNFRVGILRTYTVETMLDYLSLSLSLIPCNPTIVLGQLDNIEQELLEDNSDFLSSNLDVIVVLWRLEELHPRLVWNIDSLNLEQRKNECNVIIDRIRALITSYNGGVPIFLSTIALPSNWMGQLHDQHRPYGISDIVNKVNSVIKELTVYDKLNIVDFGEWYSTSGVNARDQKMDIYAGQPISVDHYLSFSNFFARTVRPIISARAKVLAVDLDNTLWGGVLGEDGSDNLLIGNDSSGVVYWHIQQTILSLKNRGILLVLLSKNNLNEVEDAFKELRNMPLKLSDFISIKVNWSDKYKNLLDVAKVLNISEDSFVFLDDQHFEQEQMRQFLPNVKILSASKDPIEILVSLTNSYYFDSYSVEDEDMNRSDEYKKQKQRDSLRNKLDRKTFLTSLELKAVIGNLSKESVRRAAQMILKTNQFNLTSKRHSLSRLNDFVNDKKNILLTLSLSDRFGDQGIVGLIIGLHEQDTIFVDSFLLSCRAIGRGAEQALWAEFLMEAKGKGYGNIRSEYVYTKKNLQVKDLYSKFKMEVVSDNEKTVIYKSATLGNVTHPEWIEIIRT